MGWHIVLVKKLYFVQRISWFLPSHGLIILHNILRVFFSEKSINITLIALGNFRSIPVTSSGPSDSSVQWRDHITNRCNTSFERNVNNFKTCYENIEVDDFNRFLENAASILRKTLSYANVNVKYSSLVLLISFRINSNM